MKRLLFAVILLLLASALSMSAQTTMNLPAASGSEVDLSWTASTSCTTANPCTYIPYRLTGTCPATPITGTPGWTALPATASQVSTAIDKTVTGGTTYAYVVETQQGGKNSVPSNCAQAVVPNPPAPATGLSASTGS